MKKKVNEKSHANEDPKNNAETTQAGATPSSFKLGNYFWGALLIIIGGLFLLQNLGVVDVNVAGLIMLWPLLVVMVGISLLALTNSLWRWVAILVSLAVLVLVITVGSGWWGIGTHSSEKTQTETRLERGAERAEIILETGAGEIMIDSADQRSVVSTNVDGDEASVSEKSVIDGDTQRVTIETDLPNNFATFSRDHELDVTISQRVPVALEMSIGAAQLKADLSLLDLESLKVEAGAARVGIRLGDKRDYTNVEVEAGASSVEIRVPSSSGVQVASETGLASVDLEGFEKTSDSVSRSSNYANADKRIDITLRGGLASFTVDRY